ncbi:murein transglycosylase [Amycolatopsis taiwanensis]|uniref:Murein transglycosylase n=2 Tax=Amycolatopsis taiwanensis TaxID=342230 RepID=A0A9W6QUN7_9PSEU|nr:murein transglycosylase [Amycolatopsis taiwanensis]
MQPVGIGSRRIPNRLLLGAGVVVTGLVLLLTIGVGGRERPEQSGQPQPVESAQSNPVPAGPAPSAAVAAPPDRPHASDFAALDSWARGLAKTTHLASNVLMAYGRAEMWLRDEAPGCHLSWATLAGIGQVQAVGSGPLPVPDAIWQQWSVRATNDGKRPDPRNADDAALTAARALCAGGADLSTGPGWWAAVLGYTQSPADTRDILAAANNFATVSA